MIEVHVVQQTNSIQCDNCGLAEHATHKVMVPGKMLLLGPSCLQELNVQVEEALYHMDGSLSPEEVADAGAS